MGRLGLGLVQAPQQVEDALWYGLAPHLIVHGAQLKAEAVLEVGTDPRLCGDL